MGCFWNFGENREIRGVDMPYPILFWVPHEKGIKLPRKLNVVRTHQSAVWLIAHWEQQEKLRQKVSALVHLQMWETKTKFHVSSCMLNHRLSKHGTFTTGIKWDDIVRDQAFFEKYALYISLWIHPLISGRMSWCHMTIFILFLIYAICKFSKEITGFRLKISDKQWYLSNI